MYEKDHDYGVLNSVKKIKLMHRGSLEFKEWKKEAWFQVSNYEKNLPNSENKIKSLCEIFDYKVV